MPFVAFATVRVFVLSALLLAAGCGQTGALFLPEEDKAVATDAPDSDEEREEDEQ